MKRLFKGVVASLLGVILVLSSTADAGPCALKVYSFGSTMDTSGANANWACLNGAIKGSGGTLISNADVSGSAAIDYKKLNLPSLYPQAWATLATVACNVNGACAVAQSQRVTSITRTAAGTYTVVLSYTASTATYLVSLSGQTVLGGANGEVICNANAVTTAGFTVQCVCNRTVGACTAGAATDATFNFLVFDSNNN